ncbi:MAG: TonB-dependent receptor plug domain-containing protein [bacterium]
MSEDTIDSSTAFSADSAKRALATRSRSSASKVVDFEMDERARFTRVEQLIQDHFPGVQVTSQGGSYSIKIRGTGSLRSNDPFVIIDGASRSVSDLRSMNPLDIKRIEIMKDGAAAFYGSRGANGVILITTGRPQ